ncbi:MAG: hypothetical protein A2W98_06020 [Bacteroidetes bacterium GWF2_33_38]|nr:MAG: hypothetical protein A2W98_06020 [Bacteroidetes bacterium GWF2_33_38]OFY72737.1 MAG: hypothetical protein A2265_02820 [Bacteroidetes bacterium RIFOXYA12_FULL_33_9]HBX49584.1 efflux transporter periplasmic adaptor subunit [Bacteroidales bacterium]
MRKLILFIIVLVVISALAFVKIWYFSSDENQAKDMAKGKSKIALVTAMIAKSEKLENKIFISGNVVANESVDLVPETAGKIVQINFKEGSRVNKGDLLVKINDSELQALLKKYILKEKLSSEKEARQKKLLNINGISQQEYDATLTELNSSQADIELTKAQIAKTEIIAPFSGIIGLRSVSEGSYVSQSTKIASIQQNNPLKIDFYIPEKYSNAIKIDDSIKFTIEGINDTLNAMVSAVEPKVDDLTRTIQVRAITQNNSGKIIPGVYAQILFSLEKTDNAILIPTQSIIPILKGQKVFICKNGIAEEVKVKTGLRSETKIEILDGIQAGDTIITTGIMQLKAGMPLKITAIK